MNRIQDYNLQAEVSLLAICLVKPDAYSEIIGIVTSGMFYEPRHQSLFTLIKEVYESGDEINVVAVCDRLSSGNGNYRGGLSVGYIVGVSNDEAAFGGRNPLPFANIIAEHFKKRRRRQIAEKLMNEQDDDKIGGYIQQLISMQTARDNEIITIGDAVKESLETIEERKRAYDEKRDQYPKSGLALLDQTLGGFKPGRLYMVGARPSTGKSELMLNFAYNMSKRFRVGIISPEMGLVYLMDRIWNLHTDVDRFKIGIGQLTDDEMRALYHGADLGERPIVFNCKSSPKVSYVRACLNTMMMHHNIDILFIDHLHELELPAGRTTDVNNWREATKSIRDMSRDFNIPVVLLAQLSRKAEQKGKKPTLVNLREAGEEVADVVLMLWRQGYQDSTIEQDRLAVIVRKNRDGRLNTVWCEYQLKTGRIRQSENQQTQEEEDSDVF